MDFLKQWTMCVCITLVISVIFSLFTPKGRMAGFYKIIISLFIFISFLYPLRSFHIDDFKYDELFSENEYAESQQSAYETMVNTAVKKMLSDNEVLGACVSSSVQIDNDEAAVSFVQVAVPDEYDLQAVESLIFDNLGINAKVIHIGQ